jgi:NADPH-dependent 2,4-dienoyl-CoA reductase/sulfur reductase-like enzyme
LADRAEADVAVVGGGPAGIAAAVHAGESGRRVLLLDSAPRPGGQVWRHLREPPHGARPWLRRLERSGARVLAGAAVVDAPAPDNLLVEHLGRPLRVRCGALVLATGARERFLPFPGWTLPGVIGAGAAHALLESGARVAGLRVVVAGSGPLLLAVAAALRGAGARLVAVVEQAPAARVAAFGLALAAHPVRLVDGLSYAARLRGVPLRFGAWVARASGSGRLERVAAADGRREWSWDCDVLACGFGLVPNLELARLLGCDARDDCVLTDEAQATSVPRVFAAGELCGIGGAGQALATGAVAGLAAAGVRPSAALLRRRGRERAFAARLARAYALRAELKALARPDTIVCRCEDVTLAQVEAAVAPERGTAAAASSRCAKLHSRAGMGACQGRVCGAALRFLFGWTADTVRPPLWPVPLAALAALADGGPTNASRPADHGSRGAEGPGYGTQETRR